MRENFRFFGSLQSLPFSRLIFHLWQKKNSGYLEVRRAAARSRLWFNQGNVLVMANEIRPSTISPFLLSAGKTDDEGWRQAIALSEENEVPLLQSLMNKGNLTAEAALNLLVAAWKEWLFSFFDLEEGDYSFEPLIPDYALTYVELSTPEIILGGIRKMKNFKLIEAHLPAEDDCLQINPSFQLGLLPLTTAERYILRLLATGLRLGEIYERCDLGKKECQRFLFTLLSFEAVTSSPWSTGSKKPPLPPWEQLDKVMGLFNEKCAYVYRFVSREIGPVARNVLEKAIEEIRPHLNPIFLEAILHEDGRIRLPDSARLAWQFRQENFRQAFLRDLNEILVAEVLAVRKTLGPSLEAALVKGLEKIAET